MSVLSDQVVSQGDIMRELAELKRQVKALTTARRLEAASVGRGGLRIQGGRLLAEDTAGDRVFEVGTDPAEIFMRPELITVLSRLVFAEQLLTQSSPGPHHTDAFGVFAAPISDFTGATRVQITSVPVLAGRAVVMVGGDVSVHTDSGESGSARIGYQVSGPTNVPADISRTMKLGRDAATVGEDVQWPTGAFTRAVVHDDLLPGNYSFELLLYQDIDAADPDTAAVFTDPTLIVIPS